MYRVVGNDVSAKHGAACLDGTNPGYYYAPANSSAMKTSWVLYFKDKSTRRLQSVQPHPCMFVYEVDGATTLTTVLGYVVLNLCCSYWLIE